jgi:hypothetical protein
MRDARPGRLLLVGLLLLGVGFAALFATWGEVAGQDDLRDQVASLLLGGCGGLGLLGVGSLLIGHEGRSRDARRLDDRLREVTAVLERVAEELGR